MKGEDNIRRLDPKSLGWADGYRPNLVIVGPEKVNGEVFIEVEAAELLDSADSLYAFRKVSVPKSVYLNEPQLKDYVCGEVLGKSLCELFGKGKTIEIYRT